MSFLSLYYSNDLIRVLFRGGSNYMKYKMSEYNRRSLAFEIKGDVPLLSK